MAQETSGSGAGAATPVGAAFGKDLLASVVVFLVALPLCIGIAMASGMPATAGLITGIIGGVVVGLIAGSPLQVSGPAAGLSVLVLQLVEHEKIGLGLIGIVVLIAGLIQAAAGILKLGQWFRAVSPAVIHGMLAGIGVLIFCSQFHVMLDGRPIGSGIQNLLGIPGAIRDAVATGGAPLQAGGIGLLTFATIFAWAGLAPKSLKAIPAPLVGVAVGMAAALSMGFDAIKYIQVPENILADTVLPTSDKWALLANNPDVLSAVLVGALTVAFIASAETLLCATAVDQMHSGPRTKYDQELAAQGVGNTLCGMLGVLPMTGVIVRSSANVESGAVTRWSAVMHGIWLVLFCALLPWTLRYIPVSALAGVLLYTGYKLAYPKIVPTLLQYGKGEVWIYIATIVTIVATDLLKGVLLGLGLSLAKLLYAFSHLAIRKEEGADGKTVDLYLDGSATLIKLPTLAAELEKLKPDAHVRVHIADLDYIDHACIDLLTNWDKQRKGTGGSLEIEWEGLKQKYDARSGSKEAKAARAQVA
jgi:MFS superfamily sulfate permease-like transporter